MTITSCRLIPVLCIFALSGFAVFPGSAMPQDRAGGDGRLAAPEESVPSAGTGIIPVLIVDGQNNHSVWPRTTELMRSILEDTGRFRVDVARTLPTGRDPGFRPAFREYRVVVSNYNGEDWPEETRTDFEQYIESGGGLVVVHAADNAFPSWPAWNRMIGLGGWGGRDASAGVWLYLDQDGKPVRDPSPGRSGSHGAQHEFQVRTVAPEHPVMSGLPPLWLHARDELYDSLRGPAEEISILAVAWSDPGQGGTGRFEPVVMAIQYGSGRIVHTTLGHGDYSVECAGFAALLQRGAEWAATGDVTLPVPERFPSSDETVRWEPKRGVDTPATIDR